MAYTITDVVVLVHLIAQQELFLRGMHISKLMPMHVWTVEHVLLHVLLVLSKINVLSACQFYSWY